MQRFTSQCRRSWNGRLTCLVHHFRPPVGTISRSGLGTYCPVSRLEKLIGQTVVSCGLVIEQRLHHQTTGEVMKSLSLADKTGIIETEFFAYTYRSYGAVTVRYPVLEVEATVEPYEYSRGFSLRVHRVSKPRTKSPQPRIYP